MPLDALELALHMGKPRVLGRSHELLVGSGWTMRIVVVREVRCCLPIRGVRHVLGRTRCGLRQYESPQWRREWDCDCLLDYETVSTRLNFHSWVLAMASFSVLGVECPFSCEETVRLVRLDDIVEVGSEETRARDPGLRRSQYRFSSRVFLPILHQVRPRRGAALG